MSVNTTPTQDRNAILDSPVTESGLAADTGGTAQASQGDVAASKPAPARRRRTSTSKAAPVASSSPATPVSSSVGGSVGGDGGGGDNRPVLLIDGHGLAFRSFHALENSMRGGFRTKTGTPTSICAGVFKSIMPIIRDINARAVLVALDKGPSFRKEIAGRLQLLQDEAGGQLTDDMLVDICKTLTKLVQSDVQLTQDTLTQCIRQVLPPPLQHLTESPVIQSPYKAGREAPPVAFVQDMHNFRCILKAMRLPTFRLPHVEADDTIAALAKAAVEKGHAVRCLTGDQDLLQLVNDSRAVQVLLINNAKDKQRPYDVMTEAGVMDKFGVLPSQFADYRALVGDKSDNIPGVTGIGPVKAKALIQKFNTLEEIFRAPADKLSAGVAPAISKGRKSAAVSQLLSSLGGVHVNFGQDIDTLLTANGFKRDEVLPLLEQLELKDFIKRLPEYQAALGGEPLEPLPPDVLSQASNLELGAPGFNTLSIQKRSSPEPGGFNPTASDASLPMSSAVNDTAGAVDSTHDRLSPSSSSDVAARAEDIISEITDKTQQSVRTATSSTTTSEMTTSEQHMEVRDIPIVLPEWIKATKWAATAQITGVGALHAYQVKDVEGVRKLVTAVKADMEEWRRVTPTDLPYTPVGHVVEPVLAVKLKFAQIGGAVTEPQLFNEASKKKTSSKKAKSRSVSRSASPEARSDQPVDLVKRAVHACMEITVTWPKPRTDPSQPVDLRSASVVFPHCNADAANDGGNASADDALEQIKALWTLFSDPNIVKAVHDAKPLHRLGLELGLGCVPPGACPGQAGWTLGCTSGVVAPVIDTLLAAYVANPEYGTARSKDSEPDSIAVRWGQPEATAMIAVIHDTTRARETGQVQDEQLGPEAQATHVTACSETTQTWMIAAHLLQRKRSPPQPYDPVTKEAQKAPTGPGWNILEELEQPLQEILASVEHTGVLVDRAALDRVKQKAQERLIEVEAEVRKVAEEPKLRLNSTAELGVVLYEKLKVQKDQAIPRTPNKAYSTSQQALEAFQNNHAIVGLISEYRSLEKMMSGYITPLEEALKHSHDNRVRTNFQQNGAVTGRFSSIEPNMQAIPIRSSFADSVRSMFVPRPGWRIMSVDYSQMELRLMAALSREPALVEAYKLDQDAHRKTAMLLFNKKSIEEVDDRERQVGKQVNFGVIYGMGANLLASKVPNTTYKQAQEFIDRFDSQYKCVTELMESNRVLAVTQGYVETAFGRRRYFDFLGPYLVSLRGQPPYPMTKIPKDQSRSIKGRDSEWLRAASNAPIQGTAADLMKKAMVRTAAEIKSRGLQSCILLTVHDELVLEIAPGEEEIMSDLVVKCMKGADDGLLSVVPLKAEVAVSDAWA